MKLRGLGISRPASGRAGSFGLAILGASALLGYCLFTEAEAQTFSNTIFFGDSNTDAGRYLYLNGPQGPAPAGAGTYTTNPDPGWAASLAGRFGISVTPQDAPGGGNDYAAGGARVFYTPANPNVWPATTQVSTYLGSTGGKADPNALYTVWIGINDLKSGTSGGLGPIISPPDYTNLTALGQQTASLVSALAGAGARYFLIPNTISNMTPAAAAAAGETYGANSVTSRAYYDQVVWNMVHAAGINFVPVDWNSVYNYVLLNPAQFGITTTSIATAACGGVNAYQCTAANWVTPNANQTYFFADSSSASDGGGHVSGAVQKIQADYTYNLIVAPSEVSFLAEAPIETRFGVINAIRNQVPLSFATAGAFHGWVSGDVSWLKINNSFGGFPGDPGTPFVTTAGFDYTLSRDWLVGAAFSGGYTQQNFSLGGNFQQTEYAVSLYSAWRHDAIWMDAIATWGSLHDVTNRQTPLGITVQSNRSSTDGTNVSFAAEGGYNFRTAMGAASAPPDMSFKVKAPPAEPLVLIHGPVAGIILQQVHVDPFSETNVTGAPTNLAFGSQLRSSAVTELGYQASIALGRWEPYAKAVWDHELADTGRLVTATLLSITAPSYSMPAVVLGKDWGALTLGTRFKFAPNAAAYAAFNAQVGQNNVTTYGGQIGLNVAFQPPAVTAKY